jgi:hypothetical protein
MKLLQPQKLLDLDAFLPSDGEDDVEMSWADNSLTLNIYYDPELPSVARAKKSFIFLRPSYFIKTPFPGHSFFSCPEDQELSLLSSLVEYKSSEMLDVANKVPGSPSYRHFRVYLHSVGAALHIVAHSYEVID